MRKWLRFILILFIVFPLASSFLVSSQTTLAYPTGLAYFPLTSIIYTNFVEGKIYVSNMTIGNSFLPNGQLISRHNASLQLNAMIDGRFWAQNVALMHQISRDEFEITMVVNFWNLTGPFTSIVKNTTTYQGLGVYCYQGPTFTLKTPFTLFIFMNASNGLSFGFTTNGVKRVYLELPHFGNFQIGGLSLAGIPNDLEFVLGGPGGGSEVHMSLNGSENLYYWNNGLKIVPQAFSVGLDTAESAYGISVTGNFTNILKPSAKLVPGTNSPAIVWPIPPTITINNTHEGEIVKAFINGQPLQGQEIELLSISDNPTSSPPFTKVIAINFTNLQGATFFNVSSGTYIAYFPGNFSLSSSYAITSPVLSTIVSSITHGYNSLVKFITTYNFKKSLSSSFNNVKYKSSGVSINYLILEYIGAFAIGIVISAVLIKYKL
ncbi:thermopsin family protease [Candidatus Acidianus copahuensis]|uniref:thermopsin family protease n=1 Tax=Candidatus Acidianus copahuensis TaxID=1160895 RepID=UPI00064EBE51|nr:thermopsin family protease [Candidatus Acidianus copahuensis]